ncbi:OmpA family protein [Ralstonia mannitolilytica]|uniref:OmpA family protein n=1 Tax=Ralstonia mannitolilytica TaxID=105219 RepID=UPI0009E2302B|nr:OmpA family protein [Ralstonia mannitolilytica]
MHYCFCAAIDQAGSQVRGRANSLRGVWLQHGLLAEFYSENACGQRCRGWIEKLQQTPNASANALEVIAQLTERGLRDERGLPLPKIALPARQKPVSATSSIPPIIEERHAPHQPGPAVRPPLEVLLVRETFPRRSWLALVVVAAVIVTAIVLGLTFMLYRQHQASRALAAQVESLSAQLAKQRESLADRIARALAPEAGAAPVGISTKDDRIYLAFSSDEGFASGRADLMPMLARQLDRLATVLADTRGKVIVLGHTDDAPGPRDRMESNLALSTLRATAVARHLQERRIASDRLSIIGRGAKDPVGDNRTAAGRALNRRVEIVLENEPM